MRVHKVDDLLVSGPLRLLLAVTMALPACAHVPTWACDRSDTLLGGLPVEVVDKRTGVSFVLVPAGRVEVEARHGSYFMILERPFYVAMRKLTHTEWYRVMGSSDDTAIVDDTPIRLSWVDAKRFMDVTGCRFPTNKEWRYLYRSLLAGGHAGDLARHVKGLSEPPAEWCGERHGEVAFAMRGVTPPNWFNQPGIEVATPVAVRLVRDP